jgi:hypothetical protein
MNWKAPTAGDLFAFLVTITGLGIGTICYWLGSKPAGSSGYLPVASAIAGMVIGGIIALIPLLFWHTDRQKWRL